MTLWARAQQLPPEPLAKVQAIYGTHFPLEVRHCLAPWLEAKIWSEPDLAEQSMFVEELVREIQVQAAQMTAPELFVTRMKLADAAKMLQATYGHAPHDLFSYVKNCLLTEMELVKTSTDSLYGGPAERKYGELLHGLQEVRQRVALAHQDINTLQTSMETFSLQYHECNKQKSHLNFLPTAGRPINSDYREIEACLRLQVDQMEIKLNETVIQFHRNTLIVVDNLKKNIEMLRDLQSEVLDTELIRWKREQQLHGNGIQMRTNLDTIQELCEALAELIWNTRQQVIKVNQYNSHSPLELRQQHYVEILKEMTNQITGLLSTLVTSTFVIEKQPPQVMKTNTRFTATVRLLVGGQLNVHMTPPRVTVTIIAEPHAQQLLKAVPDGQVKPPECGEILNNQGTMEFNTSNKQLAVSFRNMQLRKIKRAEKKGTESVMDEKLTLFFHSKFKVGGGELDFQVWTLSLPVVVIVHGNQEPHGWATVTWDNAFSQLERLPFAVPDKVTWGQLSETLYYKFKSQTNGGELSQDNLRFLAEKIFRCNLPLSTAELNAMTVSWTQFCKDALPERSFTFWEWFYMVVKVTRDYLKELWREGLIMGFIQKKQAEDMLSKCQSGTFLLRFSDSELGGITIAWIAENEVYSLQPFTSRDLTLRSLADRVLDLPQLQYLYPNSHKNDKFASFYTKQEKKPQSNGYVEAVLVTKLPDQFNSQTSPDSHRNTPSVQSSCQPTILQL
ncbi:signal transducer and activator of transcription 5B isoform X3 [Plutella xylostella]|uniref:signal transducer and activator of transcription 5B isoform X3 n=1 Tax=Plutella xylostella TaxID=51655 RepID=UPI0018D04E43|nr:signal transducer and activator of transcription 5B isoform X3 [Plutella xylostella]